MRYMGIVYGWNLGLDKLRSLINIYCPLIPGEATFLDAEHK